MDSQQYAEWSKEYLDLQKQGVIEIIATDTYRYVTDKMTQTLHVVITTREQTIEDFHKAWVQFNTAQQPANNTAAQIFGKLPRVSMFIGPPDTGKTYKAFQIAQQCGVQPLLKMCRDNLNLETLLEDFIIVDGKPMFQESLAIKMMSGTEPAIIIFDEFNTLLTGVMKTLQPIFDETSTTFEYRGKVYTKNMNCKFIVTLNDKDKGISIVPDAILSRSALTWFDPVSLPTLHKWLNYDLNWITAVYNIYKSLGILPVFGSRQLRAIKSMSTAEAIKNHLKALCMMKNVDPKVLEVVNVRDAINKLI